MCRLLIFTTAMLLAISVGSGVSATADEFARTTTSPTEEQLRFFESRIRPLLANHCNDCHGEDTQASDLRLDTLTGMLTGGKAGPVIVAGRADRSLLLTAVGYQDNDLRMPPEGKLTHQEIKDLTHWIEAGAAHPESATINLPGPQYQIDIEAGRKHWAFQPLRAPEPPSQEDFATHPIDAFINARLKSAGLRPLDAADKRTLIRRASFDLIGLPPRSDEINAFLADESEHAFARVVERLLASPHYGERWGRHWLDVARYADSNGLDENVTHGNAWRYRDYVIDSLNHDKPYNEFIVEQLAGDLLDSGEDMQLRHQRLIATGFLTLGPKVLAEVDKAKMEMDIVDEQLDTIGRSIMGLTLGCARCHTHKFDPIGHDDYYALAGIFKSTRTMESFATVAKWNENSIAQPADLKRQERHQQSIADQKQQIESLLAKAKQNLPPTDGETPSQDIEQQFSQQTQVELERLRDELKQLELTSPSLPTAMGVTEGAIADTSIHLRGSHLTLGDSVPRRFPRVLAGDDPPGIPNNQSGRLELARWLTDQNHPLTARVMVNRIWRWHFGKGLVETVDNFGVQGDPPSHPDLLDWLATRFIQDGWSIKSLHRSLMSSRAYQRRSGFDAQNAEIDVDNQLLWRFNARRLEAEVIRDSLLAVSGTLDRTFGGSLLRTKNHEFVFNHTSQDRSSYKQIRRRSVYVPVIRNHLYDVFQLFDYTDASVLNGDRDTSTIAPQALFLMNSDWVAQRTAAMAQRIAPANASPELRIKRLFELAYGREATADEVARAGKFLCEFDQLGGATKQVAETQSQASGSHHAWQSLCQAIISSSEFVYIR